MKKIRKIIYTITFFLCLNPINIKALNINNFISTCEIVQTGAIVNSGNNPNNLNVIIIGMVIIIVILVGGLLFTNRK